MKVALVHDYLTQRGGAERVFLSMCQAFPDAPIYTSLYEPDLTFPQFGQFEIHTTPLNRIPLFRRHHRLALPLFAPAFSRLDIDADVVICSSSGWAHGEEPRSEDRLLLQPRTMAVSDQPVHRADEVRVGRRGSRLSGYFLRRWDQRAAHSAHTYVAISETVRQRVQATYGIHARVIEPATAIDPAGPQAPLAGLDRGFFLCVSRLMRYKNVEAIVNAFKNLPSERLVIVGRGPMEQQLRSLAPPNVELIGTVTEPELRWLYANCQALVAASYEDFGLTPVEALAFGKPSVVLRYGGFTETVIEWETGVFFDEPTGPAIEQAVRDLQQLLFAPDPLVKRAESYSVGRFEERLHSAVASAAAEDAVQTASADEKTPK